MTVDTHIHTSFMHCCYLVVLGQQSIDVSLYTSEAIFTTINKPVAVQHFKGVHNISLDYSVILTGFSQMLADNFISVFKSLVHFHVPF